MIKLALIFRYRREVHSEKRAGKVVSWLCDRASLGSTVSNHSSQGQRYDHQNQPFEFILDNINHLLWQRLDMSPAQIDSNTRFQIDAYRPCF